MTDAFEQTGLAVLSNMQLPSAVKIGEDMEKSFGTMYAELENKISALDTDMSEAKNREAARSLAYKISQTKVAIVNSAKGSVSEFNDIVKAVTSERTKMETKFDALRDKARAALTAWEEAETARKARVQTAIDYMEGVHVYADEMRTSENARADFVALTEQDFTAEKYGEDARLLMDLKDIALERLDRLYKSLVKAEHEAAELEQLRKEKADREAAEAAQKAEDARKAEEAAETARKAEESARAAQEAEAKANEVKAKNATSLAFEFARLIDRAATAASGHIADYIETADGFKITDETFPAEKIGELCAAQAETIDKLKRMAVTKAGEEQDEAERKIAARKEAERKAEIERQEQQKVAAARAEEQAKEREEKAAAAERERIRQETAAKEKADQERAADLAHRKKLNGEAVKALMKAGSLDEKTAQIIIVAIYKEQIPHVAINY